MTMAFWFRGAETILCSINQITQRGLSMTNFLTISLLLWKKTSENVQYLVPGLKTKQSGQTVVLTSNSWLPWVTCASSGHAWDRLCQCIKCASHNTKWQLPQICKRKWIKIRSALPLLLTKNQKTLQSKSTWRKTHSASMLSENKSGPRKESYYDCRMSRKRSLIVRSQSMCPTKPVRMATRVAS